MKKNVIKLVLALALTTAGAATAMAGGGGWTPGSQLCFSNCGPGGYYGPSPSPQTGPQVATTGNYVTGYSTGSGYNGSVDTFGPQPTTTTVQGQAAPGQWGGTCPTCASIRHVTIRPPAIHVVAIHR
jgi:hypothetical protein